jgi:hypothetical protein
MSLKPERFIKMFINDIGSIHNLSGNGHKLLRMIAIGMQSDNRFLTTPDVKLDIAKKLKVANRTVDNLFNEIVRSGLIEKQATNIYMMNPYIFGVGNERSINFKRVNFMKIRYSNQGRTFELGEEK